MSSKKFVGLFLIVIISMMHLPSNGQSKITEKINALQAELQAEPLTPVFSIQEKGNTAQRQSGFPIKYELLDLDKSITNEIVNQKHQVLKINLPFGGHQLELALVSAMIVSPNFKLRIASKPNDTQFLDLGVQYWGKVVGYDESMVALSITKNAIGGVISFKGDNYNLGKLENSDNYIFYRASDFDLPISSPCEAKALATEKSPLPFNTSQRMDESNCVGLYVETALDIFTTEGSIAAVTDKVILIFTEVIALYANESINMHLNELLIWDVDDPYDASTPGGYLNDLVNHVPSSAGDLIHLLSYDVTGGSAFLNQLCDEYNYGFSGIVHAYNTVPTYSWTIEVIAHEIGHNLGSHHTHACVWNGNDTPIDGCGPSSGHSEGCDGDLPDSGTIMSYCHLLPGVGIDFNLGFGTQPGDLIRNNVYNADCLNECQTCETIGEVCDDGDDCTVNDIYNSLCNCVGVYSDADNDGFCTAEDPDDNDHCIPVPTECLPCSNYTLTIDFDQFPEETYWEIINDSGQLYTFGGAYVDPFIGLSVEKIICLIDGCYEFVIYDYLGNGICCNYGEGAYQLVDAYGSIVASGDIFGASESATFCIEETNCLKVDSNDGEFGWGIWNDDGEDASLANNVSYANSGIHSFLIRDNTSGSSITTEPLDLNDADELLVGFNFTTKGFNSSSQDFWLQKSTDGGTNFTTMQTWTYNTDFTNNVRHFESCIIEGPFTANTQLRFKCDANANNDKVFIDDIEIYSCTESTATCNDGIQNGGELEIDCGGQNCIECNGCYVQDYTDFEDNWGIWSDGGVDARRNTLDSAYANSGIYCIRLQDGTSQSKTISSNLNMSNYDYINVSLSYVTSSMESGEGFKLQISTNGGDSYSNFRSYKLDKDFKNGIRENVSQTVFGPFTSATRFRIKASGNNNSDRVYIDDIVIEGCYLSTNALPEIETTELRSDQVEQLSFQLMPNPLSIAMPLSISIDSKETVVNMQLMDLFGKTILNKKIHRKNFNNYRLETAHLNPGTYLIKIGNLDQFKVKKFVIIK